MTRNLLVDLIAVLNRDLASGEAADVEAAREMRDRLLDELAEEDLKGRAA